MVAEDADLTVRFGTGRYADVEHVCLFKDEVTPLASPAFHTNTARLTNAPIWKAKLRSPLEPLAHLVCGPWRGWAEPTDGSSSTISG